MIASVPGFADSPLVAWPSIPGYKILARLYENKRTAIYRATRTHSNSEASPQADRTVIIKLLCKTAVEFEEIARFRNQVAITRLLNVPGIAQVYELSEYQQQPMIVMEDFGGLSLNRYMQQHDLEHPLDSDLGLEEQLTYQRALTLQQFLAIGIQIADILAAVHQKNVIHKDIKPHNILIHPPSGRIQLIDFSLSSQLPREQQGIHPPEALEGSLAYLAPEQTGRMNRGVDYRSDFYALGVTFYELLSGRLPFQTQEALALIHCHIAIHPPNLRTLKAEVPETIAAIVEKLMAKNPEDRYQSAIGLKHDLETCLNEWKATGTIPEFSLGRHNQAPPFIVSEKLYGRASEIQTLMGEFEAVAAGETRLVLVGGFSGIGKTALINEVHKPILEKRGYFISGKFDQLNRNRPFSAMVKAFEHLITQLIESGEPDISLWKHKILSALEGQGQVIADLLPDIEQIIGPQSSISPLSGTAAQNRFNQVFQQFIQVFTQPEHPLVLFLDDLQWADLASLQLLETLASQSQGHLLLLGAYRDNEVFPAHPFSQMVERLTSRPVAPKQLILSPLTPNTLNQLTTDTLRCPAEEALALTQLIYSKAQGNPFFTTQYLKTLQKEGLITFQIDAQCWHYNLATISQVTLTDDVVSLLREQLKQLSKQAQDALKLAACIGNVFDLHTLSIVCDTPQEWPRHRAHTQVAAALWEALQAGMILPVNEAYKFYQQPSAEEPATEDSTEPTEALSQPVPVYRFLHDRVQQAAYALIPTEDKQQTHTAIGQLLLDKLSESEQEEQLFEIVNHFNQGDIQNISTAEKQALAKLNLRAGVKAIQSAAGKAAYSYCQAGLRLLPQTAWQTHYPLMYSLHQQQAEAAYLSGQFEQAEAIYQQTLAHCQTPLDKAKIYRIQVTQYELQGRHAEAIDCQRESLALLGWDVPKTEEGLQLSLTAEIEQVNTFLKTQTVESRLQAEHLNESSIEEMMRILQILFYAAWLDGQPILALLAVAKMTTLSWTHGNSEMSPFGYACYGLVLGAWAQDYENGYKFGQMAVQLCDQFDNANVRSMTNFVFGSDVQSWSRPIRDADSYYETAYHYGMEAGNWLTVGFMMMLSGSDRLTYGKNLNELYQIVQTHADFLNRIQSLANLDIFVASVVQPIRQLLGLTVDSHSLDDDNFSEADFLANYQSADFALAWLYAIKIRHAVLFKDEGSYTQLVDKLGLIEATVATHAKVPSSTFYTALMHLQLRERAQQDDEKQQHTQKIAALEAKLQRWAKACPENIAHKCLILEGEKARLNQQWGIATEKYDKAIALANQHRYYYEAAFAGELAAQLFFDWDKPRIAKDYLTESYISYERWGAIAKLNQLKQSYPSIFDDNTNDTGSSQSITFRVPLKNHQSPPRPLSEASHSLQSNLQSLDLTSLLKASQALSSEVQLEQVITALLRITLENAGANRCALLLPENDSLQVKAIARNNSCFEIEHLTAQLTADQEISVSIIETVQQTLTTVIIDDASITPSLKGDAYIEHYQPKSILCFPIQQSGRLSGILYLENRHTAHAFTPNHLEVLKIISVQAAISLENSRLYEQQDALVKDRTQALNQALENLKISQMQLIQKEKMSSLGQLVGGIAHEINNPISFIYGNIGSTNRYVQDLIALLESYQTSYPNPVDETAELLEDLDIDFVIKDLDKTLTSMKSGAQRIRDIVLSLRSFSRLDEAEFKQVNIHEGIESTLMLLQNRLNGADKQKPIRVEKQYGDLPQIPCFASEMNQVFFNILNNAIDALSYQPTSKQTHKQPDQQTTDVEPIESPCIRIQSERIGNDIVILFSDNGKGIENHVLDKVFDPFFTTKPVGQGTGMGLAIAHQTITEKHQGTLTVTSQVNEGSTFTIQLPIKMQQSNKNNRIAKVE